MPVPAQSTQRSPPIAAVELRPWIEVIMEHLDHVLPGQAPILNFVHHNTLHGFQHLPFARALAEAERLTGISGYLPEVEFRRLHAIGRIGDDDLDAIIEQTPDLAPDELLFEIGNRTLHRRDLYRIALIYGIDPVTPEQLRWSIEEWDVLDRVQTDVPPVARHRLLSSIKHHQGPDGLSAPGREAFIRALWKACLEKFGLDEFELHPEELIDLSVHHAEHLLAEFQLPDSAASFRPISRRLSAEQSRKALDAALRRVGDDRSLRDLLVDLTGEDVLASVRPLLIRYLGSFLDEGLAAWHAPDRAQGFYSAWRHAIAADWFFDLSEAGASPEVISMLPEDPGDALISELLRIGLQPERWEAYLARVALELPGWSGMVNWRATHPNYPANGRAPVSLIDYLAVRLILDRIWLTRVCRQEWGIEADLPSLERYFNNHLAEFSVRLALFRGDLPEYLAAAAQRLSMPGQSLHGPPERWRNLADMIFTWNCGRQGSGTLRHTLHESVWRLFRLAQHLGMTAPDITSLPLATAERWLSLLDALTPQRRAYLWLQAYERHYREQIFNALAANHGQGRWAQRRKRPESQLVFCMDDREESIRRHLEELNPAIETLGAAGFFGVAMNWRGLDDAAVTALCPIVVTPAHEVREVPRPGHQIAERKHRRRLGIGLFFGRMVNNELRRNLVSSLLLIDLLAPIYTLGLLAKILFGRCQNQLLRSTASRCMPAVSTELAITAEQDGGVATPENPRMGFSDIEQADRVAAFLRNTGLTNGFAPLVVLMGHGSSSQNNPHLAAYDCGACSGRHGGPNARAFAAMANRPEIRRLVAERGIAVPADTWFIGSEHNTCSEEITWFDLQDLPPLLRPAHHKLKRDLDQACQSSAHERCRRFASAPRSPSLKKALKHVVSRSTDFSQARPELGHATNAAAFVGRRSISQGVFFDRRVFLISYDPTIDPDGSVLEGILLAVGPVGAGINLEYYFSTVNNERFGCGTKVPHNVTGLFGVMEGTASDLRTGLPRQMIEIHEAMRLLVVVEQKPEVLTAIYDRQAPLRELIGNEWIQLATLDPEDGQISLFVPDQGFVRWRTEHAEVPTCVSSTEWYAAHSEPLPPALIRPDTKPSGQPGHA